MSSRVRDETSGALFKVGKIATNGENEQRGRTGSGKEGRRGGREG